jgi:hypothetical protein
MNMYLTVSICITLVIKQNEVDSFKESLSELCEGYSALLFHSIDIIKELNELNTVKNILFKWLKEQQTELRSKDKIINDFRKNVNSLTYVNDLLYNEISEYKSSLEKVNSEYEALRKQFLGNNRYEMLSNQFTELSDEFGYYRQLVSKEVSDLKYDLNKVISERDLFRAELIKLKELFYKFNL